MRAMIAEIGDLAGPRSKRRRPLSWEPGPSVVLRNGRQTDKTKRGAWKRTEYVL